MFGLTVAPAVAHVSGLLCLFNTRRLTKSSCRTGILPEQGACAEMPQRLHFVQQVSPPKCF